MRLITIIFLILVILGCTPKQAEVDKLVVAMELQFPPFETTDEAGNPSGISVEIAQDLARYMNKDLEIRNTSWVGLIPTLQTEKADLILSSMSVTEERSKVVDFSIPYAKAGLTLLLNKKSKANNFSDLNNNKITIAVKSGTIGAIVAKNKLTNAKVHYFDDVTTCVLEVIQGKADAFIYDALTVYENHKKHPETTKINLSVISGTDQAWAIAVKKGNEELLKEINSFILKSQKEKSFEKISEKYLEELMQVFQKENIPSFWDVN